MFDVRATYSSGQSFVLVTSVPARFAEERKTPS
jgi:hypothetical protein